MIDRHIAVAAESSLAAIAQMASEVVRQSHPVRYTVTGAATIVETYMDAVLRRLIDDSDVGSSRFGRALLDAHEEDFYRTWDDRFWWLHRGFGIEAAGSTLGQDVRTLIELRNAIVHGGGRLTARQSKDLKSLIALEHRLAQVLHVQVDGLELRFFGPTAAAALDVARSFVLWLDLQVRGAGIAEGVS